jgi:hypothetical protein
MNPVLLGWVVQAVAAIAPPSGAAEDAEPGDRLLPFLPAPAFVAALDPSILLVLGERGTGKTELFQVLRQGGLDAVLSAAQPRGVPASAEALTIGEDDWGRQAEVSGYFRSATPEGRAAFWLGLLARRVATTEVARDVPPSADLRAVLTERAVSEWAGAATGAVGAVYAWLDDIEAALETRGMSLVVCYDQLDRTTLTYVELFAPLRALLQLWFEQRRRWRRLRPKVFLRPDLFDSQTLAFPDGSKFFRASVRELTWTRHDLYQMWVKRLANGPGSQDVVTWAGWAAPRIQFLRSHRLGLFPLAADEAAYAPLVHSLVGPYMGPNARKGESYNWVPNHVVDAHQRMAPRSFLTLWQAAAQRALERPLVEGEPMRPEDLHFGLQMASDARILELAEDDPWMAGLRGALRGLRVPVERDEIESRLREASWPAGERPPPFDPVTDTSRLLDHLARRGVVAVRDDGRVAVPDLYLFGLDMKRKGGVRRG